MAKLQQRRKENISGNFYVDETCIDCDTCRWMAPEIFYEVGDQSAVYHQPSNSIEELHALQALLSCPTASIGTVDKPKDIKQIQESIPILVSENVYHCGYHAENSFGAASYLIVRPEGNILVDSPRFSPPLVKKIEAMGGIKYLYLTHRDDVADHQKYREHFGCDRILHRDEINSGTKDVEIQLTGDEPYSLSRDLLIIPVPGHTKGHTVLLYDNKYLFTGDHLAWSDAHHHLYAFKYACWYSWSELKKSMNKLAFFRFEWVLPGHGRRYHADATTMKKEMQICLDWLNKN
ncbi:MBL fold metallo-hydrolase [Chroococcus sp. FPU101]|uniref:MBL fold metallo-hydrolase n=1 Tax=Chroococcus sp. FPU101 TaxID=1974212 RepID=UPI001A8F2E69|nr:MBL fold metallo-hydrolase [Chroococcus sp. FPU101]GFE68948.1 beta-lactamase domain-containing protein [Chroococcus sp. FPU101]